MLPNLTYTACLCVCVCACMHALLSFTTMTAHAPPKLFTALEIQLLPPVPRVCVWVCAWLGLAASARSPLIVGLTVTTLLHTSRLHVEGRSIGGKQAHNWPTEPSITYSLAAQLHRKGEGGRRGRRRRRGGKKKENPENSTLANIVKPSGRSSFALEE